MRELETHETLESFMYLGKGQSRLKGEGSNLNPRYAHFVSARVRWPITAEERGGFIIPGVPEHRYIDQSDHSRQDETE